MHQSSSDEHLSANVRFCREALGLTHAELGDRVGVSASTIQKLERRKIPNPGIRTLRSLAALFGVPLTRLLDEDLQELDPLDQTVHWLTQAFPREGVEHYILAVRASVLEMAKRGAFRPPPASQSSGE